MPVTHAVDFVLRAVTTGLAIAFLVTALIPSEPRPTVEIRQVQPPPARLIPAGQASRLNDSFADAVRMAAPAVVNINSEKVIEGGPGPLSDEGLSDLFNQAPTRVRPSLGSGVIVSPDGYILTNHHVIADARQIEVTLANGHRVGARVIGTDPETDLAVLKSELENAPSITLGWSDQLEVGDVVLAIGNPFGVGQTVTQGIVSAIGRDRLGLSQFAQFIQTDAAINPGNSGGALINPDGELIAVNTAIFTQTGGSQGIGFAIPIDLARRVMTELIETGEVVRGWLGLEVTNPNPRQLAEWGVPESVGARVTRVLDGPARAAGLRRGDVITHLGQHRIRDTRDLLGRISLQGPGTSVTLRILREGQSLALEARVARRPNPSSRQALARDPQAGDG